MLSVDHVTVESTTGEKLSDCKLVLSQNEVREEGGSEGGGRE